MGESAPDMGVLPRRDREDGGPAIQVPATARLLHRFLAHQCVAGAPSKPTAALRISATSTDDRRDSMVSDPPPCSTTFGQDS